MSARRFFVLGLYILFLPLLYIMRTKNAKQCITTGKAGIYGIKNKDRSTFKKEYA